MKRGLLLLLCAWCCETFASPSIATSQAMLRALNKQTGRASDITVIVGEATLFDSIAIEVKACFTAPDFETPENSVFVRMLEVPSGARGASSGKIRGRQIFSGWMFSSSPSLSALEHPNYDIWLISCGKALAVQPVAAAAPAPAVAAEEDLTPPVGAGED